MNNNEKSAAQTADAKKMTVTNADIEDSYARWAPVYDRIFNRVFTAGRTAASQAVNRLGGKVLNVGVGTGLELPMFAANCHVSGIDLSEPMLDIARKRVAELGLKNVDELRVMDALHLEYPDASFDLAVAPYVVTTVPDPHRCMEEMVRVVRPGGEIILVNHVATESGPIAWIERMLARRGAKLGWDPLFPWSIIGDWIAANPQVELLERRVLPPLGLFNLIRLARK